MSGWDEARVEQLRVLLSQGLSASQAARTLGVTRNSVIGKASRLCIPLRQSNPAKARHTFTARAPKPAPAPPPPPPPEEPAIVLEDRSRLTVAQLTDHTCRWPIGDPQEADFHFCGREPELGRPYCPAHVAKAYVPMAKPGRGKREHAVDRNDAVATGRVRIFGT